MQVRYYLMVLMFLGMGFHTKAQDSLLYQPEVLSMNVDSLIADSIKKAFILNHKPLKRNELDTFVIRKTKDALEDSRHITCVPIMCTRHFHLQKGCICPDATRPGGNGSFMFSASCIW